MLSALSCEPAESLRDDPESVGRAGRAVLAELGAIFSDSTAVEEERLEAARQRERRLQGTLLQQGLPVSDNMEDLPDRLQEMYHSPDGCKDVEPAAAGLEVLAEGLERAGAAAVERLRMLAERLREQQPATEAPEKGGNAEEVPAVSEQARP